MTRYHTTAEGNIPFTAEEEAEWDAQEAAHAANQIARKAVEIRSQRNQRLKDTDWTQVADARVDKAAWAVYRQALRDITAQTGFPWEVQWPTQPE
jgi:hypothetical protein